MEDLAAIIGTNGTPALIFYTFAFISAVFLAGWGIQNKIKSLCDDATKDLISDMGVLQLRVESLEKTKVDKEEHDRTFQSVITLLTEVKTDVRNVSTRMDTLLLHTKSDN